MNASYAALQRFLRETSGFAFDDDKGYLVEDKLRPLLRAQQIADVGELARRVQSDRRSPLAQSVIEALTINETSFFRDKSLFAAITDRLLPSLMESRKASRQLRIWCAGCSTGQEPYSLAMLIDENARLLSGWQIEIVATDLSQTMIESARRGLYSQFEIQRGLPVAMLLRHFEREGDCWQISNYLRAKVSFHRHNLLEAPRDLGQFDMIFCRNVLIYFDVATKRRVLMHLSKSLMDDGYLALGAAETVSGLSDVLTPCSKHFVFTRSAMDARASA